jgi:Zn-dependent protease with chaperone function
MPIAVSLALILAFILPAFILFEPFESGETIGLKMWAVIGLAVSGIAAALFRVFGSWWRTRRLIDEWSANAMPIELWSVSLPAFRLRHTFPVFAVVGVLRPRLFVAERLLDTLEPGEINAVLKHEFGHIAAMDNLKRLIMKMCGDILVMPIGRSLDKKWSETSERAADYYAVEYGGRSTAVDLASALIKIARLVPDKPLPPMPIASSALAVDEALAIRVRRLLSLADGGDFSPNLADKFLVPLLVLVAAAILILATNSGLLERVHEVSEMMLAVLQ